MLCLPCRSTLDHLLFGGGEANSAPTPAALVRRVAETGLIACITFYLATRGNDLAKVFGFTGATAGTIICYVLPPACYLQLRSKQPFSIRSSTNAARCLCIFMLAVLAPLVLAMTW